MLTFASTALLAGLAAVVVPPIVHFFSRKKIDETDWAAMQFLHVSKKTRRRVHFEQILLMLLRMMAIALIALAFAGPVLTTSLFQHLGLRGGERDIVILIDGSASMSCKHDGKSAAEAAREWAGKFLDTLRPGDRVTIFQAKQQPVTLVNPLSGDLAQAKNALELLPPPRGNVDWPANVQAAISLLDTARPQREIIVISDGQRAGWADEGTVPRWELIGRMDGLRPRIAVMNVAAGRGEPFNLALEPIKCARGVASADREVQFSTVLHTSGPVPEKAKVRVLLEVDGQAAGEINPEGGTGDPLRKIKFTQRFVAGSHLVTLRCEGDDFTEDNRQDFALEVLPAVPVLMVDGTPDRAGRFLNNALAPARDTTPAFLVKTITPAELTDATLIGDMKGPGTPPRVIVLYGVTELTAPHNDAVNRYLAGGGSVLVVPTANTSLDSWNKLCFQSGKGWLPARLAGKVNSEARPVIESFTHPALDIFKEPLPGGLHTALFFDRVTLDLAAGINGVTGTPVGKLNDREPIFAERGVGRGRVVLSSVPFDKSGGTVLTSLPDFVRLSHELLYYLAGAKSAERNLAPGQPIVFAPRPYETPSGVSVQTPDGSSRTVSVSGWPMVFDNTLDAGPYKLTSASGRTFYYAARSEPQESQLASCTEAEEQLVANRVPGMTYVVKPDEVTAASTDGPLTREIWWWLLLMVIGVLFVELLYTRRLGLAIDDVPA